jgi:fructan beta-fructosidase
MKLLIFTIFISGLLFFESWTFRKANFNVDKQDSGDIYRPTYHFTADSNWINDPNGLVYNNGEYQLFYQYNPFGANWGHMSWGHSMSKDLLHWKKLPIALKEDKKMNGDDSTMIFSGSAVSDKDNTSGFGDSKHKPMVAIYTSFVHKGRRDGNTEPPKNIQSQSIAYSTDNGITWTKYNENPVLDIHSPDYRDPKVFWYQKDQKWVLVLVKSDQHEIWLYESKNLKKWNYMSRWGKTGDTAAVWECPDLFELPVAGTNERKWVLTVCAGNPQVKYVGMQYFTGRFDGKKFTTSKVYEKADYLDFGKDFYAAVSYNNTPDNRRIIIGWLNNWVYANDIPTGNIWRGAYSIPRQLSLVKSDSNYIIVQKPIFEFSKLRGKAFLIDEKVVDSVYNLSYKGNAYEMELTIEPGNANAAGLKILESNDENVSLKYDVRSQTFLLDRTKSGNISFNSSFASVEKAPVKLKNGKLKLTILVDKSIVEVFINDGEKTITDLVFPMKKRDGIQLFTEGGKAIFSNLKVWEIKSTMP